MSLSLEVFAIERGVLHATTGVFSDGYTARCGHETVRKPHRLVWHKDGREGVRECVANEHPELGWFHECPGCFAWNGEGAMAETAEVST